MTFLSHLSQFDCLPLAGQSHARTSGVWEREQQGQGPAGWVANARACDVLCARARMVPDSTRLEMVHEDHPTSFLLKASRMLTPLPPNMWSGNRKREREGAECGERGVRGGDAGLFRDDMEQLDGRDDHGGHRDCDEHRKQFVRTRMHALAYTRRVIMHRVRADVTTSARTLMQHVRGLLHTSSEKEPGHSH